MQVVAVLMAVLLEQQEFQLGLAVVEQAQAVQVVAVSFVAVEVLLQQLELAQVALAALVISTLAVLLLVELEQLMAVAVEEQGTHLLVLLMVIPQELQLVFSKTEDKVAQAVAVGALLELMELVALVAMALSIFITKERNGYTIRI
jgi:hypothetical protein